ncbi:MAG: efflux RND transporter periplasmic adaptor subunit [Lautropia sp.]|nr:efflux RND transporter periplasmic adaptor subunit [Lautropia sp.]
MSSSVRVFLGVCLLTLMLAGVVFLVRPDLFGQEQGGGEGQVAEAQTAPRPALTVTTTHPQRQCLAERLPVDGSVTAWQEAVIASETNGLTLVEVLADVGDEVKKGQVLARFLQETPGSTLHQARAAVVEAQAAHAEARANADRAKALANTGAFSRQQIEQYRAAEQTARARLRSAQAALAARRNDFRQTELRAPDDGVISARSATMGSVPGSGTELFRLIRQGRLEWQPDVSADDLSRVRAGNEAVLQLPGGEELTGLRVRAVSPAAAAESRMARVHVDLPKNPALRSGMYLGGEILFGKREGVTVPMEALVPRDGFNFVYRLNADKRIERVRVAVGRVQADRVEVLAVKGEPVLSSGDEVVVKGAGLLSEGDLVRVENGAGGGAAGEGAAPGADSAVSDDAQAGACTAAG